MRESAVASSQNAQLRGKSIKVEREFSSEKVCLQRSRFHLEILPPGWENLGKCSLSNQFPS